MIRRGAEAGDYVVGFAANSMSSRDNALIYVAKVAENLAAGEYYEDARFARRRDRIYRKLESGGYELRKGVDIHADQDYHREHDLGPACTRPNVLISEEFSYFCAEYARSSYKAKYPAIGQLVEGLGRGHRLNHTHGLRDDLEKLCLETLHEGKLVYGRFPSERVSSCRLQDKAEEGADWREV